VQEFVGDIVEKIVDGWIDVSDFLAALWAVLPAERSRAVGTLQQIDNILLHARDSTDSVIR
jgi:hypothetical protein